MRIIILELKEARTLHVRAGKNILLFSGQSFESKSVKHLIALINWPGVE